MTTSSYWTPQSLELNKYLLFINNPIYDHLVIATGKGLRQPAASPTENEFGFAKSVLSQAFS